MKYADMERGVKKGDCHLFSTTNNARRLSRVDEPNQHVVGSVKPTVCEKKRKGFIPSGSRIAPYGRKLKGGEGRMAAAPQGRRSEKSERKPQG